MVKPSLTTEPPTNTDLYGFGVLCHRYTEIMLNYYTENGAEASGSKYAAGGCSAFEDEAYGDVSLARSASQPHFGGVNNVLSCDSSTNLKTHAHTWKNTVWFRRRVLVQR